MCSKAMAQPDEVVESNSSRGKAEKNATRSSSNMEASSTVAAWLSFGVTAFGLGSLISQANAINDKLDPFHANRTVEYLGMVWIQRQAQFPWWVIAKSPPVGPVIKGSLPDGFCGSQNLHLTRVPLTHPGKAGWAALLSIIHLDSPVPYHPSSDDLAEKALSQSRSLSISADAAPRYLVANPSEWDDLPHIHLIRHQSSACVVISRATIMLVMCLTNARKVFQYSDAAGFRAGYGSYCGQWYITWPIGQEANVKFAPHDSHNATSDVYPPSYPQRVDRCVQMLAGIIEAPGSSLKVAFCGRKASGRYQLKLVAKGFPGAHGSRHLYNMLGGKVYEVDFMSAIKNYAHGQASDISIELPSTESNGGVSMIVGAEEEKIMQCALDCLPWTSMSWSIHRGLRDILVAYAKPTMDKYREHFAALLKQTVVEKSHLLASRGWNLQFVRHNMGDMAASAVLAGSGSSGDLVRVVTDIVLVLGGDYNLAKLDDVNFWRRSDRSLDLDGVIALTKLFVLEWSNDFDYQLYHDLPISLFFG
ncbi:hypothetical protein LTR22_018142 [Elasticomyces elasticus]|nr:hypothetical protein LTR22_018142 [Elasticomyces elasticus]KAK5752273.1 hypothetical protein LTS12_017667 [Elasticomyces elasticus]